MSNVTSKDGTTIAYDRVGDGPPVVIVLGGPTDRSMNAPVADLLAPHFTVFNYDRRARGESGDTQPFSVDREYEDLQAVLDAAGGSAALFGTSGGAVLALEAAARGLPVTKLALWEPPFVLAGEQNRARPPKDYGAQVNAALAAGRPGDAVEIFFVQAVGLPAEFVGPMRDAPFWSTMEAVAPALAYDAEIMGDFLPDLDRLASIDVPTLVLDGGTSPWLTNSAEAVAAAVPGATRRTLDGQQHNVAPDAIAPVLDDYFSG